MWQVYCGPFQVPKTWQTAVTTGAKTNRPRQWKKPANQADAGRQLTRQAMAARQGDS